MLAPPGDPLSGIRIATNVQRHIYSLGGFADSGLGVLRLMESGHWQRVNVNPSSAMRGELGFVFDTARNRFVAFGSSMTGGQAVSEVWEYDGSQWTKSGAAPPPGRLGAAMVYDARRKRTVLFGGMGARRGEASAPLLSDTWEFDGTTWTPARVAGPTPRLSPGVAYDSKRGLVLVFGGANHERVLNDFWAWDGNTWKKLAEGGPEPRVMGYLAYDKKRDRVVLFGGRRGVPDNTDLGDTWEWDGSTWRRFGSP
jgi:N-acetylneuraminic acid mutarotase